jgi:predicted xylose isomerase-like sugar epimerase
VKIALDPYMHRHLSLEELPRKVADLGYDWIELSPRDDFLAWWVHPRTYPERIASFKKALKDHGVKIASLLPMYRWASPHEDERQTAVRYWRMAVEIAVEMGVDTMNSEFGRGPSPDRGTRQTAASDSSPTSPARPPGATRWWSLSRCSRRRASSSTSSRIRRTRARRFTCATRKAIEAIETVNGVDAFRVVHDTFTTTTPAKQRYSPG